MVPSRLSLRERNGGSRKRENRLASGEPSPFAERKATFAPQSPIREQALPGRLHLPYTFSTSVFSAGTSPLIHRRSDTMIGAETHRNAHSPAMSEASLYSPSARGTNPSTKPQFNHSVCSPPVWRNSQTVKHQVAIINNIKSGNVPIRPGIGLVSIASVFFVAGGAGSRLGSTTSSIASVPSKAVRR